MHIANVNIDSTSGYRVLDINHITVTRCALYTVEIHINMGLERGHCKALRTLHRDHKMIPGVIAQMVRGLELVDGESPRGLTR